jgi:hypothetical protein
MILKLRSHVANIELKRLLIEKVSIALLSVGVMSRGEMDPRLSDIKGTKDAFESKSDRSR